MRVKKEKIAEDGHEHDWKRSFMKSGEIWDLCPLCGKCVTQEAVKREVKSD